MDPDTCVYETGVDDTVSVFTSMDVGDDPSYEQAMRSNDRPHWIDARDQEMRNLDDFGVRQLIAADKVPVECDIFGTKLVCKHKRGKGGAHDKFKIRCVMLGNQLNAIEARRRKRAVAGDASGSYVELRVTAPTLRHSSFKASAAVGVIKGMRRRTFDVTAAYLQGTQITRQIYVRAPPDCREYDERGVEFVWLLLRPLYGEPDAGRVWYNTFAHHMIEKEISTGATTILSSLSRCLRMARICSWTCTSMTGALGTTTPPKLTHFMSDWGRLLSSRRPPATSTWGWMLCRRAGTL